MTAKRRPQPWTYLPVATFAYRLVSSLKEAANCFAFFYLRDRLKNLKHAVNQRKSKEKKEINLKKTKKSWNMIPGHPPLTSHVQIFTIIYTLALNSEKLKKRNHRSQNNHIYFLSWLTPAIAISTKAGWRRTLARLQLTRGKI